MKRSNSSAACRQTEHCLVCHGSSATQGAPGHLVRSLYTDPTGQPILSLGSHRIDQTSPIADRWGGWYVTGTSGEQKHLGNLIVPAGTKKREEIVQVLLQGLQRMEYRGYDSAGLSTGKGMRPNDCILQASPSTAAMT